MPQCMRAAGATAALLIAATAAVPGRAQADSPGGPFAQLSTGAPVEPSSEPVGNAKPRTPQSNRIGASPENISPNPRANAGGDQTLQEPPVPTSPPPRIGLFPGFGKTLLDDGVDFHGIAFDHFLANPSAGIVTGQTSNLAAVRPAVDLDLQKIAGIPGGNLHFSMTFFGLRSDLPQILTQVGGFQTGFQTTPAVQTNIVSLLTYEQRLLGDRLSLEVGRTNVYNYFELPNGLDPFTQFSPTFQITADLPSPPYPNWGGRALYKITPSWYVQAGAFVDNYTVAATNANRFGVDRADGAQVLAEVGERTTFETAAYPSNFELGAEWSTRTGRYNLKGTGAPANALLQPTNYPGGGVLFMQGLQTVWRGAKPDLGPPANVAIYGQFNAAVDKPQPVDADILVGANFTGFIPGRPFDALGVQARYQRLSQDEQNAETRRQRLLIPGNRFGPKQPRDGVAFEAVANIQATPSITFRPIVEYFVNPDNYYPPAPAGRPRDGVEVGFFAVVSLGRFLGTSLKPN